MKTTIFTLIITIGVAILSVFQFDRYQKFTYSTQAQFNELQKNLQATLHDEHLKIDEVKEQTHDLLLRIEQTPWKMAEIHYLITLAATRLNTLHDIPAAIRLLSAANIRLQDLNDPVLYVLQQAVSRDLAALEKVALPDSSALWIKINDIMKDTKSLTPRHIQRGLAPDTQTTTSINNKEITSPWKQKLQESLKEIKELVKVRHYTKPVEPLLTKTQQMMVQEILRALLEQIRLAMLEKDQTIYNNAIVESLDWLNTYFDTTDTAVLAAQEKLTHLKVMILNPDIPALSALAPLDKLR
jgi:uroporphyrin-3 C-methyltransferase